MTSEEYDKKRAEIEYKANIEKGKLAEQYLKERGVLNSDGTVTQGKSITDMSYMELCRLSNDLHDYQNSVDAILKYERYKEYIPDNRV